MNDIKIKYLINTLEINDSIKNLHLQGSIDINKFL